MKLRKNRIDRSRCTFCPEGDGGTGDHIPPRSFYWEPLPPNVITVPCCNRCRVKDQEHDRFLRNLFISFVETEAHPMVAAKLIKRRDESFYQDKQMVPRLTSMMTKEDGRDAFNINDPRVRAFVERVARGAIFAVYGIPFFPAEFDWTIEKEVDLVQLAASEGIPYRHVGEVFSFAVSRGGDGVWFVSLVFYKGLQISVKLCETGPAKPECG